MYVCIQKGVCDRGGTLKGTGCVKYYSIRFSFSRGLQIHVAANQSRPEIIFNCNYTSCVMAEKENVFWSAYALYYNE